MAIVGLILLVQGPIYDGMGIEKVPAIEKYGILLQQMGAVVYYEGNISQEQKARLNNYIPYDNIKEHYSPCLVDNLKWHAGLRNRYLADNTQDFLKLWGELLVQNPSIYFDAYLLEIAGFWDPDIAAYDAYVQNFVWDNRYGLQQRDYFEKWFGFSFQHFVNPRRYISSAWLFVIFLLGMFYVMKNFGWRYGFVFTPQIGIWLTLMVATPIAVSLRYVAALLFTLSFVVVVPVLVEREA